MGTFWTPIVPKTSVILQHYHSLVPEMRVRIGVIIVLLVCFVGFCFFPREICWNPRAAQLKITSPIGFQDHEPMDYGPSCTETRKSGGLVFEAFSFPSEPSEYEFPEVSIPGNSFPYCQILNPEKVRSFRISTHRFVELQWRRGIVPRCTESTETP